MEYHFFDALLGVSHVRTPFLEMHMYQTQKSNKQKMHHSKN